MKTQTKGVTVKFSNPEYNYNTSVNPKATNESLKDYFIGTYFDMGSFPKEDLQKCIDIEIY